MLIHRLIVKYFEFLRTYKQISYLILFFSLAIFSFSTLSSCIDSFLVKLFINCITFFATGFFISIISSFTYYFFMKRISTEVFIKNVVAGCLFILLVVLESILEIFPSIFMAILSIFFTFIILLSIIIYSTETTNIEKAILDSFFFIAKYPHYFVLAFLLYILLGAMYYVCVLSSYENLSISLLSSIFFSFVTAFFVYLLTILYLCRYSSYKEIIKRELCSKRSLL